MRAAILRHTLWTMRSQWWPAPKIKAWQDAALVQTMRHAVTAVPFYRSLGIAANSIAGAQDLERFPIVAKHDLQQDPERFLAAGVDRRKLHSSRTSGSTGEPTVTWFDDDTWALCKYALKIRRILTVTSPFFRRCLIVSDEQVENYRLQRPFGSGFLYSEHLVSLYEDLPVHRRAIAEFQPDMLNAFPSYFLELAHSYREAGAAIPRIPFLFTSSEVLTEHARRVIETSFGGRVFDSYGSTEFKEVSWECPHGGSHVNFESVHVEANGGILLTTLRNRAMPLLRYRTGDSGTLEPPGCPCGRDSPQLRIAMGRDADVVHLPGDRRLSPFALTTLIGGLPGLHQYRIVHEEPARMVIEFAASPAVPPHLLEDCRTRLLEVLGEPMQLSFVPVPCFDRRDSVKHKLYVRRW